MATSQWTGGVSGVRRCNVEIYSDGDQIPGIISCTVRTNRWYQANSFQFTAAVFASGSKSVDWYGSDDKVDSFFPIEIYFIVEDQRQLMMSGQVDRDTIKINNHNGGTVTCYGRDDAAAIIDTPFSGVIDNPDVKAVGDRIAELTGLNFVTDDGSEKAHNSEANALKKFMMTASFGHAPMCIDVLMWMAKNFNYYFYVDYPNIYFNHFVDEDVWPVYFQPPDAPTNENQAVDIQHPDSFINLELSRDFNLARNTGIIVKGYNPTTGDPYEGADDYSKGYSYMQFFQPGLTSNDDAKARANELYKNTLRHEKKVRWTEPGDLFINCHQKMQLTGGSTVWHQSYYIESIERTISNQTGFIMTCQATNQDQDG